MIAYKFLAAGRVAPFTRHVWPAPGEWLTTRAAPAVVCLDGVHACTARDLPLWLDEELWTIELDGQIVSTGSKVAAERGRLVERIGAWNAGTSGDFALACTLRARDHALGALRREGSAGEATAHALGQAFTAGAVVEAGETTDEMLSEPARAALGFATDAAGAALGGECAAAAYVAAYVAGFVRGDTARQAERAWQADWLTERLELR